MLHYRARIGGLRSCGCGAAAEARPLGSRRLWVLGLECLATLPLSSLCAVQSMAFDGSARFLAVTGQDGGLTWPLKVPCAW